MVRTGFQHGARALLGAAAVLVSVLGLAGAQPQPQVKPPPSEEFVPTLAVDPSSGAVGDVISVSGRGWVANSPVTLSATPVGENSLVRLGEATPTSATVLAAGPAAFDTAVTIPASAPGDLTITACQACDDPDSAGVTATVVVLPPVAPTDTTSGGTTVTPGTSTSPAQSGTTPSSAGTPSVAPALSLLSGPFLPLLAAAGVLVVLIVVATVGLVRSRAGVRAGQPVARLSATSRPDPAFPVRAEPATRRPVPNLRLVPHPTVWTVATRREPDR